MLQHRRRYQNGNNFLKKQMKSTNHLIQTVGLLVGANCAKELVPNKIMLRQVGGLHEFRAILIWWIVRPVGKRLNCDNKLSCQKVSVNDVG